MHAHRHVHKRDAQQAQEHHKHQIRDIWDEILQGIGLENRGETSTVYVYYTPSATFDGPTATLVTQTDDAESAATSTAADDSSDETTSAAAATSTAAPVATTSQAATTTAAAATTPTSILVASSTKKSSSITKTTSSSGTPTAILPKSTTVPTTFAIAVASATTTSKTRTSSSATASATSTASSGMSTGGKAGLAIGIVMGLGAIASLIFFCLYKKRKAAERERLEDEKSFTENAALAAAATKSAPAKAPRLSLRPVTQFMPTLAGAGGQQQRGNDMAMSQNSQGLNPQSAWERPSTSASQDRNNPFGNHAELDSHNAAGAPIVPTGPGGELIAGGLVVGAAAGIGLARGASKRENNPKHLDYTRGAAAGVGPPSPNGTEFSEHSTSADIPTQTATGAAIAAAGGPQNSVVHRVQLDFKPSMDDEIELKAGQLIRLLHEYDDGWALCIRLDRSQQGVCPRTCLSTRPVKPRQGPPPGSYRGPPQGASRPGSANGQNRGPGPQNNRPGSAASNRGPGPQYRPGSASSNRGQGSSFNQSGRNSPAMQSQTRSQSPALMRPASPSAMQGQGSSPPREQQGHRVRPSVDRKPLPGMAM